MNEEKIDNLYEKIDRCGKETAEFVNYTNNEIVEFPVYCNNRCCDNPQCKQHRGYLYRRNHIEQIVALNEQIKEPKAWVFTGWKKPIGEINRRFLQKKLIKLFRLMSKCSSTSFSIHMEIKLNNDGTGYIHFHVVSGGIDNLRMVRAIWNRQIKYEKAIKLEYLTAYVSKYASKTPDFMSDCQREIYHCLVYKLQMNRFEIKAEITHRIVKKSDYVPLGLIEYEIYRCLRRHSEKTGEYHPFIELYKNRDRPPPVNLIDYGLILEKIV